MRRHPAKRSTSLLTGLLLGAFLSCVLGCERNADTVQDAQEPGPPAFYIQPSSAHLGAGATVATFSVVGSQEPFAWSVADADLGDLGNNTTARTVNYRRVGNTEGVNTIQVRSDNGWIAHASVVQDDL
jgi:hypothetical protein